LVNLQNHRVGVLAGYLVTAYRDIWTRGWSRVIWLGRIVAVLLNISILVIVMSVLILWAAARKSDT